MTDKVSKILSIDALANKAAKAKSEGKKVVLCHGTFDLLHVGHVRHFERALEFGDVLFVTLTADKYVLKGPSRPVFTETLRAEMIAAIGAIEGVSICHEASAISAIDAVKPDFYVKGSDYVDASSDVTNKIVAERETVENHGGQLVFTEDVVFSSSSLLNRHFGLIDESLQEVLENFREKGGYDYFQKIIEEIKGQKVLMIGETIIDDYVYVSTLGKSAKESIIATQFNEREIFAGGVLAAANHVSNFVDHVKVQTFFGKGDEFNSAILKHINKNVDLQVIEAPNIPTIRKQRFIDQGYLRKMFEIYFMDDTFLDDALETEFLNALESNLEWADVVIVTDFGHGMMSPKAIDMLCRKAKFLAVNTQTNSANRGFNLISKYPKADFVCIDEPELRQASHEKHMAIEDILNTEFPQLITCPNTIITHGRYGCYSCQDDSEIVKIPALTTNVLDSVGAGDAFFAVSAPLVAKGMPLVDVAFVGNAVGALKVNIVGHRSSVEKAKLLKFIETVLK